MEINMQKKLEDLKKGKVSYKTLTLEEIEYFKEYLQKQINEDKKVIEGIKEKISIHKKKIKNM